MRLARYEYEQEKVRKEIEEQNRLYDLFAIRDPKSKSTALRRL